MPLFKLSEQAESFFAMGFNFKYIRYENSLCVIATFFPGLFRSYYSVHYFPI